MTRGKVGFRLYPKYGSPVRRYGCRFMGVVERTAEIAFGGNSRPAGPVGITASGAFVSLRSRLVVVVCPAN